MSQQKQLKIIISGAGLIGLLIAQSLKSRNIDFVIFDRDESVSYRESEGWAITLHWAMETFKSLLPETLVEQIYEAQVLPDFHKKDTGNFKYINASTTETVVSIPPSKRLRVRREQIRKILLSDIDVQWGCKLESVDFEKESVSVTCANGIRFTGNLLLGCEGSQSKTRKLICPNNGDVYQLPIRFGGARVQMTKDQVEVLGTKYDPLLFQGTVPSNNTFFWFSMLSTPEHTKQEGVYYGQVNLSWNVPTDHPEPFSTKEDIAKAMKHHSEGLAPELKSLVDKVVSQPENIQEIKLCDWPYVEWDHHNGLVLLAGDSAHAMTMYRGEAANHGITDVRDLMVQIDEFLQGEKDWAVAADDYCSIIKSRAQPAVLLSRQACMDAHDFSKIRSDSESPLLSLRKNTK